MQKTNFSVKLHKIVTVNEIPGYWTAVDYLALLEEFGIDDAQDSTGDDLRDLLYMAITDSDPSDAAEILLTYKLSDRLTKGQINQLAHEMREDKVAEEYPEISLHETFFHINQLLYKAFGGKFPNSKASIVKLELIADRADLTHPLRKKDILRLLRNGFSRSGVVTRLYPEQLEGKLAFPEAEHILWEAKLVAENQYELTTTEYWMNEGDFDEFEFTGQLHSEMA